MQKNAWIVTLVGTGIAAAVLLLWLGGAKDAAQQTATATIAIAFAVIPFIFAKAWEALEQIRKADNTSGSNQ
ncbi:hypothetical protein [Thiopseudomonas denitrificans]|uniref:Uncharacterized protein n=1 Tax=Thiopseudomonas denitrificans TaxID=1501432 RepID=A0A4R6TXI5_9GAMM|nr:hypothetical protein [Thiopseudomonas denitrificans]TDQ38598.1 hypothetical protein DFQ45_104178 [Thiopseudomonas denitrificans]